MAQAQSAGPAQVGSVRQEQIESRSPATGRLLGTVMATAPECVAAEVAAAREVQPLWALLRISDRARYVRAMAQAIIDELDEIVETLCAEQGRPAAEVAALEALAAVDALIWIADSGARALTGRRVPVHRSIAPAKRARVEQEPFGVIAVIGAGSAPLAQPLGQIAGALLAGNGVIFKPARRACMTAQRIAAIVRRAGLPEGLVRVLHGDADVGVALTQAPVDKVLFTGSPATGRMLARECVARETEVTLELGGKDAMLVLADADVDRAVAGALWAGTAGAGQARGCVERIYVARELQARFLDRLVAGASAMRIGDPANPRTQVGPLASQRRLQRVQELVESALPEGARMLCGGPLPQMPPGCDGAFYAPTVLMDVNPQMQLMQTAIDGPVIAVTAVESVQEAITLANMGDPGLGASVWSADKHGALRIARELRAGMVWLNDHLPSPMVTGGPWGAAAGGGLGRTLGQAGLRACAQEKLITWDPPRMRGLWWGPYGSSLERAAKAAVRLRSARESDRSMAWRGGAIALARAGARTFVRR
ncbi:MAG TPA: aldehyde dehydrogenase family protein [Solirubrobacteraceae bacterium]|jgi:succinate-semialdehyde dehydrogenase/glutarate-semialdehyde dehydrogenase|nr:aldehyde dehydrogenase family protein [Solirubrobacteraceae bacterium]